MKRILGNTALASLLLILFLLVFSIPCDAQYAPGPMIDGVTYGEIASWQMKYGGGSVVCGPPPSPAISGGYPESITFARRPVCAPAKVRRCRTRK